MLYIRNGFLPLGNTALEADTIKVSTNWNWQSTVLVPLNLLFDFFFVCGPGWCRKLYEIK